MGNGVGRTKPQTSVAALKRNTLFLVTVVHTECRSSFWVGALRETEGFFSSAFLLLPLLLLILKEKVCEVCSPLQQLPAKAKEEQEWSGSGCLRMKPFRAVQVNRSTGQGEPLQGSLEMKDGRQQLQRDQKKKKRITSCSRHGARENIGRKSREYRSAEFWCSKQRHTKDYWILWTPKFY